MVRDLAVICTLLLLLWDHLHAKALMHNGGLFVVAKKWEEAGLLVPIRIRNNVDEALLVLEARRLVDNPTRSFCVQSEVPSSAHVLSCMEVASHLSNDDVSNLNQVVRLHERAKESFQVPQHAADGSSSLLGTSGCYHVHSSSFPSPSSKQIEAVLAKASPQLQRGPLEHPHQHTPTNQAGDHQPDLRDAQPAWNIKKYRF